MNETITPETSPVLTEIPRYSPTAAPTRGLSGLGEIPFLNLALFCLTLVTTTMAGAYIAGGDLTLAHPFYTIVNLVRGLAFSVPLMAILLFHELGHYLTARRNGVNTSLPYFIPAPFPSIFIIGTFGAFIRMKSPPRSRRVMFDVGAAGPWAGMLLAVPVVIIGLKLSQVLPLQESVGGLELGNSLLFKYLAWWVLGVDPDTVMINLHPIAVAGWIGLFVTALNLLPVGQLDGGHVIYALFGERHSLISRLFVAACLLVAPVSYLMGWPFWAGWMLWALLLLVLGVRHPSTEDVNTPLDRTRRTAAWLTVALFVATFVPVPLSFTPPSEPTDSGKVYEVIEHHHVPVPQWLSM